MPSQKIAEMFDLSGKSAIVTGGAKGIGKAIASTLAAAGAAVLVADADVQGAESTATDIRRDTGRAAAARVDVSQAAAAERAISECLGQFGSVDVLVNNAGVFPFSPASSMTEAQWDRVLDINLKGAFFMAQAAAKEMIKAGKGGRIVNIASIDALHPTGNLAHYDASKGGLVMLTKSLALEWGRHGITVNAIAPGSISTPGAAAASQAAMPAGVDVAQLAKSFLARIPLGRMGEPDDIASVVLFLSSGAARYMTGSLLVVDGGYLLS